MIDVSDITFRYPGTWRDVFTEFSLRLSGGGIYGLLGKNGTGKSTLLYILCGLLRSQRGNVLIDGEDPSLRLPGMLRETFIVPEEFDLPPVTLDTYIRINEGFYPRFSGEVLKACLRDFELPRVMRLDELSMGQKKKVYMCIALASGTRMLFMDEPTNGLDIPSKALFRKVVKSNMQEGRTLIISTHQVHDVEPLLSHILILDESKILLDAPVSGICSKYAFEYRLPTDMTSDVIYAEPTLQGNAVIVPRKDGATTRINLELLFNAVVKGLCKI